MATEAARVQAATPGVGGPSRNALRAVSAWGLAATIFVVARGFDTQYSMFWAFGLAFGFVLQRGRFCFASAFRDLFLLGHGRTMKGVLLGLAVASVGFGIVMARQVPVTTLGFDPPSANVLPIGVHTMRWVGFSSAWAWCSRADASPGASIGWARDTSHHGSPSPE